MNDAVMGILIGAIVTLLIAMGGGVRWSITKAIDTWDRALGKRDAEIADLRNIREDTLATGIGEARAASRDARDVSQEALDIVQDNNRLLHELLDEWKGRT